MSKGLLATFIKENPKTRVDADILQYLVKGRSSALVYEFVVFCRLVRLSICCFYEQQPTNVGQLIGKEALEVVSISSSGHKAII